MAPSWNTAVVGLRRLLVRHPALYWALVLVVGAVGAADVQARVAEAGARAQDWSLTEPVLVARTDLAAGAAITAAVVERVPLPRAAVPPGALAEVVDDLVALDPLAAGEVVLAHHTTAGTGAGPLLPPGTAGVFVPVVPLTLELGVGDHVQVLGLPDELGLDPTAPAAGSELTPSAAVVRTGEGGVVLAVAEAAAAAVAEAAATGRAVLVLRRAPAPPVAGG